LEVGLAEVLEDGLAAAFDAGLEAGLEIGLADEVGFALEAGLAYRRMSENVKGMLDKTGSTFFTAGASSPLSSSSAFLLLPRDFGFSCGSAASLSIFLVLGLAGAFFVSG
jgi:hypothetical protein